MEYSPMMVFMLWALTPSDCWPTGGTLEQARVVEIPQPVMSVHPEGAYFTFNHGRPFLAERNPLTGAVDSNIKTTPISTDDYLYEEYEESGEESIDRKDNTKLLYTRNDITSANKDVDLHKFLNLPVHYSSSGKYPLISSSYANTKVQGHGPLSNHKLHSTLSTPTTTTIVPSYYPLKTRGTTSTTTSRPLTSTTTSTGSSSITTSIPFTRSTSAKTTSMPTLTTTTPRPITARTTSKLTTTTTSTTTSRPYVPNYEYEYEYEYDKSGEATEKNSQDYEFLGASFEVTKIPEKTSTINDQKLSTTSKSTTVLPPVTMSAPTATTKLDEKPQPTTSKKPNPDDILDLRPPKPIISVDLRPPQAYPTRPFSSVLPTKQQNFGYNGFIRYPEPELILDNKKPINNHQPQNTSSVDSEKFSSQKSNITVQVEGENNSKPLPGQQTQKISTSTNNKDNLEDSVFISIASKNFSKSDVEVTNDKKTLLQQDKFYLVKNPDRPQVFIDKARPPAQSAFTFNLSPENSDNTNRKPVPDIKRPRDPIVQEEIVGQHTKHQEMVIKPEGSSVKEHTNLQGQSVGNVHNKPPPERWPQIFVAQEFNRPLSSSGPDKIKSQVVSNTDTKLTQKPQGSVMETRLQVNNRPPNLHYDKNQQVPYSPLSPNYPIVDPQFPIFGLRVTDKPHISERPLYNRPHDVRIPEGQPQIVPYEQKIPNSGVDVRIPQGTPGENVQKQELSAKPVIFSKPQSGKRPDYNTVQFGQPSKVENHFISVSPGHENPSYSLQTSFSIGVPPPEQKQPTTSGQGVGQVLFPDEEPEKRRPPPQWPHQRPPAVLSQSDTQPNILLDKYPRPPWESHLKPPHMYHKKEQFPPIKRKPLPNILPQFRPNAKVGHAEPHVYLKPREPYDTLQPPPLPRPQFLRLEQEIEEPKPPVHRRNGQSSSSRVTTLQMMQAAPPPASKRGTLRIEDSNEKNEPVFVVYPSNANGGGTSSPPSDGVVVGTSGSQRPLPPDNLDIGDDLDSFPLDNNNNFQTRVDTPVLKSKPPTSKPIIKNEFPYTLIKPNLEDRITPGSIVTKDYTAFSPTLSSIEKDHDTEINIIPYLQDYMPFATKKPHNKEDNWLLGTDIKHLPTFGTKQSPTTSTTTTHDVSNKENHRVPSDGPMPQDFQAPFHASLTAPSQGWSVVQKKTNVDKDTEEDSTTSKETNEIQTTEEPKFDIQNFKPQLFGGFKPIAPPVDNENKE